MVEGSNFKRILITGAGGQLGRALTAHLMDFDGEILALDLVGIDDLPGKMTFIKVDLTNEDDIRTYQSEFSQVDYLIHLASIVEDSRNIKKDAAASIDIDILGTLTLLKYLPALKGICYSSSYMVYGPTVQLPIAEDHPTNPFNIYGTCKLACEHLLRLYGQRNDIPVTILRYTGMYGPGTPADSKRLIPSFIRLAADQKPPTIFGDGTEQREALYIDDAAEAILSAVQGAQRGISGTFNISSGRAFTVKELAGLVIQLSAAEDGPALEPEYQKHPDFDSSKLTHLKVDISKAEKELGFVPKYSLKEGLAEHINWYHSMLNKRLL